MPANDYSTKLNMTYYNDSTVSEKNIAFLFKGGRRLRLAQKEEFPREFFYGLTELKDHGFKTTILEEEDFGSGVYPGFIEPLVSAYTSWWSGINAETYFRFKKTKSLELFNQFEAIVATTNSQGLGLALLRKQGLLKAKVICLVMGLLPNGTPKRQKSYYEELLKHISVAPLSQAEEVYLKGEFSSIPDLKYLPFGIDSAYWTPSEGPQATDNFVLSIGNDLNRDYETLVSAWRKEFPPLKIVTKLPVPKSEGSIEVISGDWKEALLSDAEIRRLFQNACFVVIPLRQTIQPSGQSACLQAMACGKTVVVSDIHGLWNRETMKNEEVCLLTKPGSVNNLLEVVQKAIESPSLCQSIGERARDVVVNRMSIDRMTVALADRLKLALTEGA